jgi:hypothetical protein
VLPPTVENPTRWYTNLPAAVFDAARQFRITSVSNGHGDALWVTNLVITRVNRPL